MAARKLPTDLLDNGASAGAVAALLGHRDPTIVLKSYGKHIDQRAEHLQGLLDKARQPQPRPKAKKSSAKGKKASPPQPEPKEKKGNPKEKKGRQSESKHEDENPHGLKVIGEASRSEPAPKSKRRKRDAG